MYNIKIMQESSHLKSQSTKALANKIEYVMNTHKQGTVSDVARLLKSPNEDLNKLIESLPKRAIELRDISQADPNTERMFNVVTKKSFDYLRSIVEHELAVSGDSDDETWYKLELQDKDRARTITHNATISAIDAWMRSLVSAGVDVKFLKNSIRHGDRYSYGDFAVGLALDIFTSEHPEIYFKEKANKRTRLSKV